jgi:hypothetical protein
VPRIANSALDLIGNTELVRLNAVCHGFAILIGIELGRFPNGGDGGVAAARQRIQLADATDNAGDKSRATSPCRMHRLP